MFCGQQLYGQKLNSTQFHIRKGLLKVSLIARIIVVSYLCVKRWVCQIDAFFVKLFTNENCKLHRGQLRPLVLIELILTFLTFAVPARGCSSNRLFRFTISLVVTAVHDVLRKVEVSHFLNQVFVFGIVSLLIVRLKP